EAVVRLEAADHPAAAVEVDEHREGRAARGRVDADGDLAARAGDGAVLDPGDRLALAGGGGEGGDRGARLLDRELVEAAHGRRHLLEQRLGFGVKRHGVLQSGRATEYRQGEALVNAL